MNMSFRKVLLTGLITLSAAGCSHGSANEVLRFSIEDGSFRNDFLRDGPTAAHVVLKSAEAPRIVIAFPAGNSGAGIWFAKEDAPIRWSPPRRLSPVAQRLEDGAIRRGVLFETTASAGHLEVDKSIIGNIRVLRDFGYTGAIPQIVDVAPVLDHHKATWDRRRIDGAPGYFLSVEVLKGYVEGARSNATVTFNANTGDTLRLRITALTGDPPLTGIPEHALLSDIAARNALLRNVLAFLAYEEKFLAGSWQYDTYFGRDTLMALALLGSALRPQAIEAGLGAVLDRLSPAGEVAHEEEIGEFALLRRYLNGEPPSDAPIMDYKMIDDDFMLAPVLEKYLLAESRSREHAAAFLSRTAPGGETYRELILRNITYVVAAARPYAESTHWSRLIRVRSENAAVGNWRDSSTGLGGGVFPYDVNAALAPAALASSYRLAASGLLGDDAATRQLADDARRFAAIWSSSAAKLFEVSIDAKTAEKLSKDAARRSGLSETGGMSARTDGPVRFAGVSLDQNGMPTPIMHSDIGYTLLFGEPADDELIQAAALVLTPYPAGLMTPAGMVVANAAYASEELAADFGADRYHGAVIWSWQQALMAAGVERQLSRSDISEEARMDLEKALRALRRAIKASCGHQAAELWTWAVEEGEIVRVPYGQRAGDETESNAAQLWSTVFLADAGASCRGKDPLVGD